MIERLLIVGFGSIGKRHLRIAESVLPQADIRIMRHKPCERDYICSYKCINDLNQLLEYKPQAAIISNPAPFHLEISIKLVEIGCHLLIEKPLSNISKGVESLIHLALKKNIKVHVGYNLRFNRSLIKYRKYIHAGKIGRILSVRCEVGQYLPSWRPGSDYRNGVSAREELGGGVLLELSHEIDYLRWIFGEVSHISANLDTQSSLEIDVEDLAYLQMKFFPTLFGNGITATLCMDFFRHDTSRICLAIGEYGTLRWDGINGKVDCWTDSDKEWHELFEYTQGRDETYYDEWESFISSICSDGKPQVTIEDGLAVINIVQAARLSNKKDGKKLVINNTDRNE